MLRIRDQKYVLAFVFLLIALLLWLDVAGDFHATGFSWHIVVEIAIGILAAAAFCGLLNSRTKARRDLDETKTRLTESEAKSQALQVEASKWKKESAVFIEGLSLSIDTQFQEWLFSPAEKDVALLLIKGLSVKEISEIRHTSEKTIRAQSHSVYSKSTLSGRKELAAFFLEDLLAPSQRTRV